MSDQESELKDRVEAKRKQLEAKIHELKADGREEARKQSEALQNKLREVNDAVKDGFSNLEDDAVRTLNEWLKD